MVALTLEVIMKYPSPFQARTTPALLIGLALAGAGTLFSAAAAPVLGSVRQVVDFDLPSLHLVENGPPPTLPATPHLQTVALQFNPFDPALGTLKQAYLSIADTYAMEYVIRAGLGLVSTYRVQTVAALADFRYGLSLIAPGPVGPLVALVHGERYTTYVEGTAWSSQVAAISLLAMDGSGPKGPPAFFDVDGEYQNKPWVSSGDLDTPVLDLTDDLDAGGAPVQVQLQKSITQYLIPIFSSSVPPAYSQIDTYLNAWYGQVALTYVYETGTPGGVSEPPAPWLLLPGLLALRLARRPGQARRFEPG